MRGYYRNAEETQRVLRADEQGRTWLCTGDVVRMDEDGFFQIVDRKKDMIIRSGLKVYPAKVEHVLRTHPRVADAAVIGRADPLHTEAVVAIVVKASTSAEEEDALADELRAVCRSHLAPYEVPTAFEFTDRIPRSVLGKVLKKELRRPPDPRCVPTESEMERRAA
jgi:long-chain acyl-CoA synthetase